MNSIENQHEVDTLNSIKAIIVEQIEELEKESADNLQKTSNLSRGMWEDAPHAAYDFDDMIELQQYNTELAMHRDWSQKVIAKLKVRKKMLLSPYFGRIDFAALNNAAANKIYIGIGSLIIPTTFKCLIYDWRAPISSMFYDFGIGEASYMSPSGEIKGTIHLKRQYKIVDGEFAYMLDSDVTIDDDVLQKELAANSESKLKVIISSIQNEQNRAIRYDLNENLTIFGPAGSGKTSVGLHRLAYELYHLRGQITSNDTLIFSQNDIFSSYISTTIPELGEDDISRVCFSQLIQKYLGEYAKQQDLYEQEEHILSSKGTDARIRGIQAKYANTFLDFLQQCISNIDIPFGDVVIYKSTICTGAMLAKRYSEEPKEYSPMIKIKRICDFVENKIGDYFARYSSEFEAHLLTQMIDAKTIALELEHLKTSVKEKVRNKIMRESGIFDVEGKYLAILEEYVEGHGLNEDIFSDTQAQLKTGNLLFEDALIIMTIKLLTGEIEPNKIIRHVLIDEAQDFNKLQHFIIKNLFSSSKYTLLGDMEQAMLPILNLQGPSDLDSIYGGNVFRLSKSYRSTKQINALAATLLGTRENEYFDRNGEKPKVFHINELLLAIKQILGSRECKSCDSIGIITKTAKQAVELYELLKDSVDIYILKSSTDTFQSGAVVIPVTLAKGLEFDGVIIPNCTATGFNGPYDKKILYLMCTRALHHLFFVCTGELSPYVSQHPECYDECLLPC